MSTSTDSDSVLRTQLALLGLKDQSDLASFCSKPNLSITARSFRILLNVTVILNFQEKYDLAFRIVKLLFTKHSLSESNLGTSVVVSLLLVEVALNCHNRERIDEDYLNCVGDAFKLLDKAYDLMSANVNGKAGLLTRPISPDGVEFFETACVVLFCHTAFYKSKVCFALYDHITAKQIINNGLEIVWKYLQFIMSESPNIWVENSADKKQACLTDYLNVAETEANGSVKGRVSLSSESITAISVKICHICKMGTSLNARAEYLSGNFLGAKAICSQLRILESLPNTVEDRRISLDNNEACISLQLRELFSASAQISRSVQDICLHFKAISGAKKLPDSVPSSEDKPLSGMTDAAITGCLYNTGLVLLKLSRPAEAFVYFDKVSATATPSVTVSDQPYVWIRLAECCMQQDIITSCQTSDPLFLQVISVSKGRSRRLHIVSGSPKSPNDNASHESAEVPSRCSLSGAIVFLKKSLEVISKQRQALLRPAEESNNFREKELLRLTSLENSALLRLTYIYLKNQDPCSALEHIQKLVDQLANDDFSQFRYLSFNYYVEVLCQLGKHAKASEFLKSHFDVNCSDAAIGSSYMSSELFRNNVATPSKLFISQFKLPPNIAAMSLQVNKAIVLILRGLYSAAVTILEAVVRLNPAFMPSIRCLIYCYIRQGKVKQALNVLNISQKAKI